LLEMSSATEGDEARELGSLPLYRVQEPRIRERDRRLVGERRDEADRVVAERPRSSARHRHDADQVFTDEDRHTEHRAIRAEPLTRPVVLRIGDDVRNVDELARQRDATGQRVAPRSVRMFPLPFESRRRRADQGFSPEHLAVDEPQSA
jgi:hypothetical protein